VISHVFPLEKISEAFRESDWLQRGGGAVPISRAALVMGG
jgi:hypothetical protein